MDLGFDESKFDGLMSEAWVQSSALFGLKEVYLSGN